MRFILLDRIDELAISRYASGVKCVSMTDDIFNHHFPGYPIMPGSLIMEGLAQLSGVLFEYSLLKKGHTHKRAVLTLVNRMKFRRVVVPGDKLEYKSEVKVFYPDEYAVATVTAMCDGELCAEGELMYGFLDILDSKLKQTSLELIEEALKNTKITTIE